MDAPHPYEHLPMLALTGVGRSGTTALRKALASHPKVLCTGHEHNVVFDVLEAARRNRTEQSRRYAMQVDDNAHDALFRRLILDLVFPNPTSSTEGRCTLVFTNLFPETATYLTQAFSSAHVVCLVRSGVEVIASRMHHPHFGSDDFQKHCTVWLNAADMRRWCEGRRDSVVVKHEALLADPAHECGRILRLIGLEDHAAPAEHLLGHTYHPTSHKGESVWRAWTSAQRRMFEERCGEAMRSLGYPIPWIAEEARAG